MVVGGWDLLHARVQKGRAKKSTEKEKERETERKEVGNPDGRFLPFGETHLLGSRKKEGTLDRGRKNTHFLERGSIGGAGRLGRGCGKRPVRGLPGPAGAVRLAENGRRGNSNLPSGGPKPWLVEAIESRVHDHTQSKACRGRYLTWRGRINLVE